MQTAQIPGVGRLINSFSLARFGGHVNQLADLDGDGRMELLTVQTAGQLQSAIYGDPAPARLGVAAEDRALYCLTAVSLDGRVLWQDGRPWDRAYPFSSHGGGHMLLVDDIDRDGRAEVVIVTHGRLRVLDGATGGEKAAASLPTDNFINLTTAQLGDPARGRQIICKVNDAAYPPWEYANPTMVFNADLSVYRKPFAVRGAGHNVVPIDVNGDGRDELLIGYSLLDHQCRPIWSLDLGEGFNYAKEHADEIEVADVDGDGRLEVRYAGSEDFFVTDLRGRVLWKVQAGHSQATVEGPWGPAGENRIILNEKNLGLRGLDASGRELWCRTDINGYAVGCVRWSGGSQWALFRPQPRPAAEPNLPYHSDPAMSLELWPRFMDGDGRLHDALPWDDGCAQPRQLIRAKRAYDCGNVYQTMIRDLDGDGLDEVVVLDRRRVWVFHAPE